MQVTCSSSDILYNFTILGSFTEHHAYKSNLQSSTTVDDNLKRVLWGVQNKSWQIIWSKPCYHSSWNVLNTTSLCIRLQSQHHTFRGAAHQDAPPGGSCVCLLWRRVQKVLEVYLEEHGWLHPGMRKPPACTSLMASCKQSGGASSDRLWWISKGQIKWRMHQTLRWGEVEMYMWSR